MIRIFLSGLFVVLVFGCVQDIGRAAAAEQSSFWAEFEGRVAVESDAAGGDVVRIVPDAGLSLVVDNASIAEWRNREGRRVEVKGRVYGEAAGPRIELWELSLEDESWRGGPTVETEGRIVAGPGAPVLRTRMGDVPLIGVFAGAPAGAPVDVKGDLVEREGRLALSVTEIELDD